MACKVPSIHNPQYSKWVDRGLLFLLLKGTIKYSQHTLVLVVMFYKTTKTVKLANIEFLLGQFPEPLVPTLFVNQSLHNCLKCIFFFLFKTLYFMAIID